MAFSQVAYNSETKNYEVYAADGFVTTFFVFPATLKDGDKLPSLYIYAFKRQVPFKFSGTFNVETDNLQFFLEGPPGFRYKASLQVDVPEGPYSWKLKRHAHTNVGKANSAAMFFVPRTICLAQNTLVTPETDIINRWSFYGQSVQVQFGRLRLKMQLNKAKCKTNPEAGDNRKSVGLKKYFPIAETAVKKEDKKKVPVGIKLVAVEKGDEQKCPSGMVAEIVPLEDSDLTANAYNAAVGKWMARNKTNTGMSEKRGDSCTSTSTAKNSEFEASWLGEVGGRSKSPKFNSQRIATTKAANEEYHCLMSETPSEKLVRVSKNFNQPLLGFSNVYVSFDTSSQ